MPERTGSGHCANRTDRAIAIERLHRATARGKIAKAEREAQARQFAAEVAGMSLDELRKKLPMREFTAAMLHLGGYDNAQIARCLGYSTRDPVMRLLRRPGVVKIIDEIRKTQLERVLAGEFGVQAQAKAAAPKVMHQVVKKAGGVVGDDGTPIGMAEKDADHARYADMVLTISGDKVERRQDVHLHLLQQLEPGELEALSERGRWPERLRPIVTQLGLDGPDDA